MDGDARATDDPTVVLYVDLDGTLLASDTLWESVCRLLRTSPSTALRLPMWLLAGRAAFKRRVAERIDLAPETLPYRPQVLELVERARAAGRRVVLVTASDERIAVRIGEHLDRFDAVLASDGRTNLAGEAKLRAIAADAAGAPFDYAGNARADLPVWDRAREALMVAPSRAAARGAARRRHRVRRIVEGGVPWRALLRVLRPHQWVKNVLVFVPLALSHQVEDTTRIVPCLVAFVGLCACASGTYLLNDLLDLEADRRHPTKRDRPFASGSVPIPVGFVMSSLLIALGVLGGGVLAGAAVALMLLAYVVLSIAYSLWLKELLFLDVLLLAGLYAHRVLTGAVASRVEPSPWLLAFSLFFFLSLAAVKRYTELGRLEGRGLARPRGRGYEVGDLPLVQSVGLSSGYLSVLVIGLYVNSQAVTLLYALPAVLWLACPILLYWITRIWFLAHRGRLPDDPVLFAATDPASYVAGALVLLVGLVAARGLPGLG